MSADMDNLTFQLECCGAANESVESDDENVNQDEIIADAAQVAAAALVEQESSQKEEVL